MHPAPSTQVDPPLPLQVGPRLLSYRNLLLRRRAVAEGLVASIHWLVLGEDSVSRGIATSTKMVGAKMLRQ